MQTIINTGSQHLITKDTGASSDQNTHKQLSRCDIQWVTIISINRFSFF